MFKTHDRMVVAGADPRVLNAMSLGFLSNFTRYDATLDPRITFSRASSATYFDSTGTLRTASSGVARAHAFQNHNPSTLEPLGFLIEEQRTNLCLQATDLTTTWSPTGVTISANAITSPNGTADADKLVEDTSTGSHVVSQNITYTAAAHTASVFAKAAERTWIRVLIFDGTNTFTGYFDLANGVVGSVAGTGTTSTIKNCGNGWYRCSITATTASGAGSYGPRLATADGTSSYTGSAGSGAYMWGAQIEAGAFLTSPILTTTAAATRLADSASITGSAFGSIWNQTEGTVVVSGTRGADVDATLFTAAIGTTTADRVQIHSASASEYRATFRTGNVEQAALILTSSSNSPSIAVAYKTDDLAGAINGGSPATDGGATLATMTALYIGARSDGSTFWNSHLQSLTYYRRRLPDATLQSLTS